MKIAIIPAERVLHHGASDVLVVKTSGNFDPRCSRCGSHSRSRPQLRCRTTAGSDVKALRRTVRSDTPLHEFETRRDIGDERGAGLRAIVDPYSYRAAIVQPKLIVLTNHKLEEHSHYI